MTSTSGGRAALAPWFAMVVGGGLALVGATGRSGYGALPPGVVAMVDGRPIRRADFDRAVAGLEGEGRRLDAEAQRRLLDRLIEEELLVAYGEELGLVRTEPRVRVELTRAVIELSNARAAATGEPDEAAVRAHFDASPARFASTERLRVDRAFFAFAGDEAAAHARAAAAVVAARAGRPLEGSTVPPVPLAEGPVSRADLSAAVGPSAADAAVSASVGAVVGPFRSGGGFEVLRVLAREADPPRFEDVRRAVRDDLLRHRADAALVALLAERRRAADVRVGPLP